MINMEYRSMHTYFYKIVNSRALVIVASTLIQCFKGGGILERNIFFSLFILIFKKDEQREREPRIQILLLKNVVSLFFQKKNVVCVRLKFMCFCFVSRNGGSNIERRQHINS